MEKRVRLEGTGCPPPPPLEDSVAALIQRQDQVIRLLTQLLELPTPVLPGFNGRLDELVKFTALVPFDWGNATGGNLNALIVAGKNWVTNIWAGSWLRIVDGTGKGQLRIVASNTFDRIIPEVPFIQAPDTTSVYVLYPRTWGTVAPPSYAFPIVSWEDYFLCQRLFKTLDGKGDIMFFESFEHGLAKWYTSKASGGSVERSQEHARGGNWALKFNLTGGAWSFCEVAATIPVAEPNRFGFESYFTLPGDLYRPDWHLYYYDLTKFYWFGVRYDGQRRKLQYHSPDDVWRDFAELSWEVSPMYYFHPVKLVIDANKLEYVKFICRGTEYDLTGLKPTWDFLTSRRAIQPRFMWQIISGVPSPSYLDDVIITTNEP